MKRPTHNGTPHGRFVTTPGAGALIQLLGCGHQHAAIALTRDELKRVQKLYGFTPEPPNKRPEPPPAPQIADFNARWDFEAAHKKWEASIKALDQWKDPQALLQAGADRNVTRYYGRAQRSSSKGSPMPKRMTIRFDITGLTDDQIEGLTHDVISRGARPEVRAEEACPFCNAVREDGECGGEGEGVCFELLCVEGYDPRSKQDVTAYVTAYCKENLIENTLVPYRNDGLTYIQQLAYMVATYHDQPPPDRGEPNMDVPMNKYKAQAVVFKALQIAQRMDEICDLAKDHDINMLLTEKYPFVGSLDEFSWEVLAWRDAMAKKAEVALCP